jgi:2-amino-4-hydroxy-6-hydroxymethyldihydropteridine diphosphokinase
MKPHKLYLSLGSNLGPKKQQLKEALKMIAKKIGPILLRSSFYETEPWGFSSEDLFLNIAVEVSATLSPQEILKQIDEIENFFGRERKCTTYTSRTMDIDILFYDDLIINDQNLTVPHPRIQSRRFVLVPMTEIAPCLIHPILQKSISDLLSICPDTSSMHKL